MSHFVMNYHDCWAELRKSVKAARADHLRKMERLEKYADSEQGRKDIEAAMVDYQTALEAARAVARPEFARIIEGMRAKLAAPSMEPPTAEQLRTLQLLELRGEVDSSEIEAAAKVMGNNDSALRALRDILARKGRTLPVGTRTFVQQARDAVDALQRAANSLLAWDGRERQQVVSDYLAARNSYLWGGGERPAHDALASRDVADIEPRPFYKDTARAIVGDVPTNVIDALE